MSYLEDKVSLLKRQGYRVVSPHPGMQEKFTRSNVDTVFAGGVLNPQPKTSHILTPEGYKSLEQVKVGDEICGIGNGRQTIIFLEDEGEKDCIRITLTDGSKAESALDHKWWIHREGIGEMTAVSFELLESWQRGTRGTSIFRLIDGKPVKVAIADVEDIGKRDCICVGVSNEDQLYITDCEMITKNCGKAQPYDAKVLTPKGYVMMGDLKEGDIISDIHGGTQTVLRIYEKGYRNVWRVYCGSSYTECCAEHLWTVIDTRTGEEVTITTEQLAKSPSKTYLLPKIAPTEFERASKNPLPIGAYKFGRILGEQTYWSRMLTDADRYRLRQLGMDKKFVLPDIYLYAPIQVRKEVLHGFIDGAADLFDAKYDNVFFVNLDSRLAKSLKPLVFSLGGDMVTKKMKPCNRVRCSISLPDLYQYHTISSREYGDELEDKYEGRYVYKAEPIGIEKPMRCILVSDESHLYITDGYIPTHNTFSAILMVAEPSLDPNFRVAFTRRNLGNLKQGGGIVDDFRSAYGDMVNITTSDSPRITFPSGAYVDCLHIADETPEKLTERAKGWQYDVFYMDELTSYEFTTFSILGTRCRGKGGFTGHIFGTTNPKKSHWTRTMLDWYVGIDGFIMPERDGVVRWYYQPGDTVNDIVFGDSPEEVYDLCRDKIDRQLEKLGGNIWTYKDIIRTFVFYAGKMSENVSSIKGNPKYIGAVAGVGGKRAEQFIEGNFNVDEDESDSAPIPGNNARKVFTNDDCRNGVHWITVDLADVGSNNLVALEWDGFHIEDAMILGHTTPRQNYERIKMFAASHGVGESHIIYDATSASYMIDYMPTAIGFKSGYAAIGIFSTGVARLKDECYMRLMDMINGGRISVSTKVAKMKYTCSTVKKEMTFQMEFLEECMVVKMTEDRYGKKKLDTKKSMNARLGEGRSMDVLDPCAMRMFPILTAAIGEELTFEENKINGGNSGRRGTGVDIYDDSTWC